MVTLRDISPLDFVYASQLVVSGVIIYAIAHFTYNIVLHPLSSYPGPKHIGASRMWWLFHSARGDLIHEIKALHDQYGDIVRIAPDQLSYVSPDAIKDIYERRAGQPENVKDPKMSSVRGSQDVRAINSATATKHAYLRKLLSPIFSIGAIKNFEPILLAEADRFIRNLEDTCAVDNGCIDLSFWFNMATFSQMGRVVFDESFEFMDTAALHWWIDSLPRFVKVLSMTRLLNNIPLLHYISPEIFMPASLKNGFQFHIQRTKTMVQKQKSVLVVGNSLMSLFLRGLDEKKLTEPEVIINAEFFVIAGSETTATHLSGTLYLLLANPATWQKLRDEVRSVFDSTDEINLTSVSKLKYMLAVQNESLRIYPPATDSPVRLTPPKGAMINGLFVPGNMKVGVNPYAAQRCSRNFSDTDCFIPERWTGEAKYSLDRREAFVPFSYGPRNCIGRNLAYAQSRLILAKLVYTFDVELLKESEDWLTQKVFLLWEKKPLRVRLSLRNRRE